MKLVEPIDIENFETKKVVKNNKSSRAPADSGGGCCKCSNMWTILLAILLFAGLVALAIYIGITYASMILFKYLHNI